MIKTRVLRYAIIGTVLARCGTVASGTDHRMKD